MAAGSRAAGQRGGTLLFQRFAVVASVSATIGLGLHRWLSPNASRHFEEPTQWSWYWYVLAISAAIATGYFISRTRGGQRLFPGWLLALCIAIAVVTPFLGVRRIIQVPMAWESDPESGLHLTSRSEVPWRITGRNGSMDPLHESARGTEVIVTIEIVSSLGQREYWSIVAVDDRSWSSLLRESAARGLGRWSISCTADAHGRTRCPE